MSVFNTILVVGATSGIGAGLTRRLHAQGKTVIATGRRESHLAALEAELPGLQSSYFDISNIETLPSAFHELVTKYPAIDTVIIAAGIQSYFSFTSSTTVNEQQDHPQSPPSPTQIAQEVNTNLTGPIVLGTLLVPFFLSKKQKQNPGPPLQPAPASIILISSALGFVPLPKLPVYCATKAGLHAYAVALRGAVADTMIEVVEIVPPYVAGTELDKEFKHRIVVDRGGPEKMPNGMDMDVFLDEVLDGLSLPLSQVSDTDGKKEKKELGIGAGKVVVEKWRRAFGQVLEEFNVKG
jgi:short-subunit dehydrogenase involved in D-alanine esterification of teichoic acids